MSQDGEPLIENEQLPSTPQLCMKVVWDYASDKISKVMAIKSIFATFFISAEYDHTPSDKIDTTILLMWLCSISMTTLECMWKSMVKYQGAGSFQKG